MPKQRISYKALRRSVEEAERARSLAFSYAENARKEASKAGGRIPKHFLIVPIAEDKSEKDFTGRGKMQEILVRFDAISTIEPVIDPRRPTVLSTHGGQAFPNLLTMEDWKALLCGPTHFTPWRTLAGVFANGVTQEEIDAHARQWGDVLAGKTPAGATVHSPELQAELDKNRAELAAKIIAKNRPPKKRRKK